MQVRPSFEWVGMYFVVARSMQNIKLTQARLSIMLPMGIVLLPVFTTTSPTKKSYEKRLAVVHSHRFSKLLCHSNI